jgi:hypothetical protein
VSFCLAPGVSDVLIHCCQTADACGRKYTSAAPAGGARERAPLQHPLQDVKALLGICITLSKWQLHPRRRCDKYPERGVRKCPVRQQPLLPLAQHLEEHPVRGAPATAADAVAEPVHAPAHLPWHAGKFSH